MGLIIREKMMWKIWTSNNVTCNNVKGTKCTETDKWIILRLSGTFKSRTCMTHEVNMSCTLHMAQIQSLIFGTL